MLKAHKVPYTGICVVIIDGNIDNVVCLLDEGAPMVQHFLSRRH